MTLEVTVKPASTVTATGNSFDNAKDLEFTIVLAKGVFSGTDKNTLTLSGFRAVVDIDNAGSIDQFYQAPLATCRIYGMSMSDMNQLTILNNNINGIMNNTITIVAIDGATRTTVYYGQITNAWPDFSSMPDVCFRISTNAGYTSATKPAPPTSFDGDTDAKELFKFFATQMGMEFEGDQVTGVFRHYYFENSYLQQAQAAATAANLDLLLDINTLVVLPKNKNRKLSVPVIDEFSGLIGYPHLDIIGPYFTTLFNPALRIHGQVILRNSIVTPANGKWSVIGIKHHLSSNLPNGPWFTEARCSQKELVISV